MSLFYNRDRNIEGVPLLPSFNFSPNYGSSIAFTCKNNKLNYSNNTYSLLPSTANNIVAKCSFNFSVNESDAEKIMNFFESQSGTGAFAISDESNIYRNLTGYADSFSVQMAQNNLYNISLDFSVERNSSFLNWSGKSFVNYAFESWTTGQFYQKYQPVYFEIQGDNKLNNFYYATQDHTGSLDTAPTNTGFWTQNLFYSNDIGLSVDTTPTVNTLQFKNSFAIRIKEQENIHYFQNLRLSYKNITDFELKSILHFLENNLGYKRFEFNCPKIYNRPKIYFADSWTHSWNYENSNNLEISLIEDPLGIKNPNDVPAILFGQDVQSVSFGASYSPKELVSIFNTSGKNDLATGGFYSVNWPTSANKNIKAYKGFNSLTCNEQELRKVVFYPSADVVNLNLNRNFIETVEFKDAKKINNLYLSQNNLSSFNCAGSTGLKYLDLSYNSLSSINISGCNNLTGINLNYNGVSDSALSGVLDNLSKGSGESGLISVIGDNSFALVNPTPKSGFDYSCICNLDYRNWSQFYKDLTLPISPTGFVDAGTSCIWLNNVQARETGSEYFLNWKSSFNNYTVNQAYTPFPSIWFTPVENEIFDRSTFRFNETLMTGSTINNNGNYLAAFVVAKATSDSEMNLLNFSDVRDYGLFLSGRQFQFRNAGQTFVIASNISLGEYYSVGFIRNLTHITGYVNGQVFNTGNISASFLGTIKASVGSKVSSSKYWQGNIAEVLIYTKSSAFSLDPSFHKPYNARFGIFAP